MAWRYRPPSWTRRAICAPFVRLAHPQDARLGWRRWLNARDRRRQPGDAPGFPCPLAAVQVGWYVNYHAGRALVPNVIEVLGRRTGRDRGRLGTEWRRLPQLAREPGALLSECQRLCRLMEEHAHLPEERRPLASSTAVRDQLRRADAPAAHPSYLRPWRNCWSRSVIVYRWPASWFVLQQTGHADRTAGAYAERAS